MAIEWNVGAARVRTRRRVSAAVLVIDDFTGQPVLGSRVSVMAAGMLKKPVRKEDGYFLFLDCPGPSLEITVNAWAYHGRTVRVDLAALPTLRPVVKIRLTPNRNYSIPRQTTCVEGTAPPGTCIRVFCENDPRPLRLLYDYVKNEGEECIIRLYDPTSSDLEGKQFALLRKGESEADFFEVREMRDTVEGCCLMSAPLSRDCKKAGATVLPVSTAQADEKGAFFLPLAAIAVKEYSCRIFWAAPGCDWQELSMELECGRVTRLDLPL